MFREAKKVENHGEGSDLIPYWGLTEQEDMIKMERIVPMYPFSRDGLTYERLIKILSLYRQSEKTHDGEVDEKKVQIKGTQGNDSVVIWEMPEYLLVEYLDKEIGTIQEIYNGLGALAWQYRSYVPSMNFYTIRINKLLELDKIISDEERITPVIPIKKYIKNITGKKETISEDVKAKKKVGKTLVKDCINRNNQENYGCLNKPGNHINQMAYLLYCNECGFEYEANGCDAAIRKCPRCG